MRDFLSRRYIGGQPLAGRIAGLLCAILIAICSAKLYGADDVQAEALRHLPLDGVLARLPGLPSRGLVPSESVAYETPAGLLFVYKRAGALFLRQISQRSKPAPDVPLLGGFVARMDPMANGIIVRTIGRGNVHQVIVMTSDGASAGSYLNAFEDASGPLVDATRGGPIGGSSFRLDCVPEAGCRVVAYGKWTDITNCWVRTYDWTGVALIETDTDAARYTLSRTEELANTSKSSDPMPVFLRAADTSVAVAKYLDQHLPLAAIQLCKDVLQLLNDPSRSIKRTAATPESFQDEQFTEDLRRGTAIIHNLLGKSYEASGSPIQADTEFRLAAELDPLSFRK